MARNHARIVTSIWDVTSDFRDFPIGPQRLWFYLLSQKSLNYAGVMPLAVKKWAKAAKDLTEKQVWDDLKVLHDGRYVVVDTSTDEVLCRTLIRNDGIAKQPNVLTAALRAALDVESPKLRRALADELRKLDSPRAKEVADELDEGFGKPDPDPSPNPPGNPSGKGSKQGLFEGLGEPFDPIAGEGEGVGGSVTYSKTQVSKISPEFDSFWAAFPRKVGKPAGLKAWKKAIKDGATAEEISSGLARWVDAWTRDHTEERFLPYPGTWLSQRRWENSPPAPRLRAVSGDYRPFQNPANDSAYDEPLG